MDNYSFPFLILPILFLGAAMVKKTEVAMWLALVSLFSMGVSTGNPEPWAVFTWSILANSLAAAAVTAHFFRTNSVLGLMMACVLCSLMVFSFGHYVYYANTGSMSVFAGVVTGVIGYIELLMVLFIKDKKGSLNELVDDARHSLIGLLHLGSHHKH